LKLLKMVPLSTAALLFGTLLVGAARPTFAQKSEPRLDLAVTYTAGHSLHANTTQELWLNGGSIELGADVWKGWGIAADVTGSHSASIGSTGIPLSLVTATFGPRYRWHSQRRISLYGEALVGEANGFRSIFPTPSGATTSASSLALQLGGGLDYRPKGRFVIRLLDAGWVRTQLPNGANNLQNMPRLGGGAAFRF
jgi:hypothetical protein